MHTEMVPLMLVPLIIWISVWGYLWTLDNKIKSLERRIAARGDEGDDL